MSDFLLFEIRDLFKTVISKEIIKEFCYLPAYKVGKLPFKWAAVVSYSQKLLFWNGWWRHALSTIVDPEGVIIQICWQNLLTITVHTEPLSRFPSSCFMITNWMNALEISGKKKKIISTKLQQKRKQLHFKTLATWKCNIGNTLLASCP